MTTRTQFLLLPRCRVSRHLAHALLVALLPSVACNIANPTPADMTRDASASTDAGGSRPDGGTRPDGGGSFEDLCPRPSTAAAAFSRGALLGAAAACARYHHCLFEHEAAQLHARVEAYRDDPSADHRDAARDAWRSAMQQWSQLEVLQFGPIATRAQDEFHGQGLRSLVYAWPNTSRCRVEEQVALEAYTSDGLDRVLINGRGLFAIEYGLFYEGDDHACLASSTTAERWPTLSAEQLAARKREYAAAIAGDVATRAQAMHALWSSDFEQTLSSATGYPSEQEALNVVAWALVYVEKEVKDWKVGVPAGYSTSAPISGPEAPFARAGIENIRENLRGFRALFEGCGPDGEGLGFDDWLSSAGHEELADDMRAALLAAQREADAFPALHAATPEQLEQLYRAIKSLTDLLKTELFGPGSPLNLKLPATIGSDTD